MNKKLILVTLLSALFITACSHNDEAQDPETSEDIYETSDFSIIPAPEWETIRPDDFTSNVPPGTQVGFSNNEKSEIFTANVSVFKKEISEDLSAEDFAKSSLAQAKNNILEFEEISSEEVKKDNYSGYNLVFEGKKSAGDPIVHFNQTFVVLNGNGYIITGAYIPDEDESVVNAIDEMINSFSLK